PRAFSLALHAALPISIAAGAVWIPAVRDARGSRIDPHYLPPGLVSSGGRGRAVSCTAALSPRPHSVVDPHCGGSVLVRQDLGPIDRKSTRLNSSHERR